MACFETDRRAVPTDLRLQDWELAIAIAGHFGGDTELLVQAEDLTSVETCSWTTVQYAQRKSHKCDFGCAELHKVLCQSPKIATVGDAEPAEPFRMMPPMYREGPPSDTEDLPVAPPAPECPSGWASRGKRCVSEPTRPCSRAQAEALCQQRNSSRVAAVRDDTSRTIIALQLQGVSEAWVRDERPPSAHHLDLYQRILSRAPAALTQPGYSVLTAEGQLGSRSPDAILPAICEHCQLPCGPGAVAFLGHCYRLLEEERTLSNASLSCAALGGALVSIESAAENRFVSALAFPSGSPQCLQPEKEVWLGLRRAGISFSWEWDDCSQLSAEFWAPHAGTSGRCTCLSPDGLWRDSVRCEQLQLLAVCEWDPCQGPARYGGSCRELDLGGRIY